MSPPIQSGEVVHGNHEYDGRLIIYILQGRHGSSAHIPSIDGWVADQTNYINYIKPLILAEELKVAHVLAIIDTKDEWYYSIHPERYVPALRDKDIDTQQDITVFESTACLQYIAERYDIDGIWTGRTVWEKAAVMSWTAYETAGLGYDDLCPVTDATKTKLAGQRRNIGSISSRAFPTDKIQIRP